MDANQSGCIDTILNKLNSGVTRISVAMTFGLEKSDTPQILANEIINHYLEDCALVFRQSSSCERAKTEIAKLERRDNIHCFTADEFLEGQYEKYNYLLLQDLDAYQRKKIFNVIRNKRVVTVSFFEFGQEVVEEKERSAQYEKQILPVVCTCETKDVLDIRDIRYADESETIFIKKEISFVANGLTIELDNAETERERAQNRIKRLEAYMKAFYGQMHKKQVITSQATKREEHEALLQADEREKEMEELKAQLKKLQEQLIERDNHIANLQLAMSVMKTAFSRIGISHEVLEKSLEQIREIRESLTGDLDSADESVKESALRELQDKVAEVVDELTRTVIPVGDLAFYKEYLVGELTQEVWDRLDEKSRAFLITAKSSYDSMIKMPDKNSMDYSGVCLLVTKALEVETTKRFFDKYKEFLNGKYTSVSQWPQVLRKRIRGQITDQIISDGEFTLGSVVPTVGYKRDYVDGNITGYSRGHNKTRNDFLDYAAKDLFKSSDRRCAESEIEKDFRFIEKVRLDYRNPSAHRDELTLTSAQNCLEYVIDVQHMLREMLGAMKI